MITVARSTLPALDSDEYYIDDLLELEVRLGDRLIGQVKDVHNTARGDVLEVHQDKDVHFIPLLDQFVAEVSITEGRILLTIEGADSL